MQTGSNYKRFTAAPIDPKITRCRRGRISAMLIALTATTLPLTANASLEGTVLKNIADSMEPGSFYYLEGGTNDPALPDGFVDYEDVHIRGTFYTSADAWSPVAEWSPDTLRVYQLADRSGNTVSYDRTAFSGYDATSHAWIRHNLHTNSSSSKILGDAHVYGRWALASERGKFYRPRQTTMWEYDLYTETWLSRPFPGFADTDARHPVVYHADIDRLLCLTTSGEILAWDPDANTVETLPGSNTLHSGYHSHAVYNHVRHEVMYWYGNSWRQITIIDSDGNVVAKQAAPTAVHSGVDSSSGIFLSYDPISGNYISHAKDETGRPIWEYNPDRDEWRNALDVTDAGSSFPTYEGYFMTAIPEANVIMWNHKTSPRLYKHESAFEPLPIIHADASRISGSTNGDPVAQWDNVWSSYNYLKQDSAALQPVYAAGIGPRPDGVPAVQFNGSHRLLSENALTNFLPIQVFAVLMPSDPQQRDSAQTLLGGHSASDSTSLQTTLWSQTNRWSISGSSTLEFAPPPDAALTNFGVLTILYNGDSSYVRYNGEELAAGNTGTNHLSMLSLGSDHNGMNMFDGYVTELRIYDNALETQTVHDIEATLHSKWVELPEPLATVITDEPVGLSSNEVTMPGTLTYEGTSTPTLGVYWTQGSDRGTNTDDWAAANVHLFDTHTEAMGIPYTYSNHVTGLTPKTGYTYRYFVTNSAGIAWGGPMGFTTYAESAEIFEISSNQQIAPVDTNDRARVEGIVGGIAITNVATGAHPNWTFNIDHDLINWAGHTLTYERYLSSPGVITFNCGGADISNAVIGVEHDGLSVRIEEVAVPDDWEKHKNDDLVITNVGSISLGGLSTAGSYGGHYAFPGNITIGSSEAPAGGDIRIGYLDASMGDNNDDHKGGGNGNIAIYAAGNVYIRDSAGSPGYIRNHAEHSSKWFTRNVVVEHQGTFVCGNIETYAVGGESSRYGGSVILDGGNSSGDMTCGSILSYQDGGAYGGSDIGLIRISNYNNVQIAEIQGWAVDSDWRDPPYPCDVVITNGIAGDITIQGEIDLWSHDTDADHGTLDLASSGMVRLKELDLDRVRYAALSSGSGNSEITGIIADFDTSGVTGKGTQTDPKVSAETRLRTPAGQQIYYSKKQNPILGGFTWRLRNLDGSGDGGLLQPKPPSSTYILIK